MPENETLHHNGKTARHWRSLAERIAGGLTVTEAFPAIEYRFYGMLQGVYRQWKKCGIDPVELFAAARDNPNRLNELIKQSKSDSYARLLRDVATGLRGSSMEVLVGTFLEEVWDWTESLLQVGYCEESRPLAIECQKQDMLNRIRRLLLINLSRSPSRRRKEPIPDLNTRLQENLL